MVQRLLLIVLLLAMVSLSAVFKLSSYELLLTGFIPIAASFFYISQHNNLSSVLYLGLGFCIILTLYLNLFFYPALLRYQSGEVAAKWLNQNAQPPTLRLLSNEYPSLKFYANSKAIVTDTLVYSSTRHALPDYYFAKQNIADSFIKAGAPIKIIQAFPDFHISKLTPRFLYA